MPCGTQPHDGRVSDSRTIASIRPGFRAPSSSRASDGSITPRARENCHQVTAGRGSGDKFDWPQRCDVARAAVTCTIHSVEIALNDFQKTIQE